MDASTISAIAALVVAVVALVIAFAQALQQYFITGQNIRLCDSVVFADMPGQGRRVWQAAQFRFRVVYSIPQISLPLRLWPTNWPGTAKEGQHRLPNLSRLGTVVLPVVVSKNQHSTSLLTEVRVLKRESWLRMMRNHASRQLGRLRFRKPEERVVNEPCTGEAAWVSFCRVIHYSCWNCVRYNFVERDVDRCPSDLPTVPMPLSLRDVVAMALTVGMKCTVASFTERSLSMQGTAGILATSQHPVLGPLLHFTPGDMGTMHGLIGTGMILDHWLARTWDACSVARRYFHHRDRRIVEKTAGVWIHRIRTSAPTSHDLARGPTVNELKTIERRKAINEELAEKVTAPAEFHDSTPLSQRKGRHDGEWILIARIPCRPKPGPPPSSSHTDKQAPPPNRSKDPIHDPVHSDSVAIPGAAPLNQQSIQVSLKVPTTTKRYQTTVEDADSATSQVDLPVSENLTSKKQEAAQVDTSTETPNHILQIDPVITSANGNTSSSLDAEYGAEQSDDPLKTMRQEAKKRQSERNAKAAKIAEDELMVKKLEREGKIMQEIDGPKLIEWKPNALDEPFIFLEEAESSKAKLELLAAGSTSLYSEEQEALDRETKRKEERDQRDLDRHARNDEQIRITFAFGRINWFWLSQTDIIPGFWATPWHSFDSLDHQTCLGAVTIILNALTGFTDSSSLRYVEEWKGFRGSAFDWGLYGNFTFPGYAHNAIGGVVYNGEYPAMQFEVFKELVPATELLESYEYQVDRSRPINQRARQEHLLELMRLDAWLSICGRTVEILTGRNDLIKQAPAMVQLLMGEFETDFINLDESDQEGGMQVNQEVAANVMDFLLDEELSGAEQVYVLVATLRAVKVGQCVLDGQDTQMLQEILQEDIQVHLV